MNQIINMILRQIMRRVVNKGIDAGINKASNLRGGKASPEDVEAMQNRDAVRAARRARKQARMARGGLK